MRRTTGRITFRSSKKKNHYWIEEVIENEKKQLGIVPNDVHIDFLVKTNYGVWKEISAREIGKVDNADGYGSGKCCRCRFCNTAFQSYANNPECPFCHRRQHSE